MARPARRLIRILAASVAAFLLLVLLGVAVLVLFVDADRFRPPIERAASSALGLPVSLGRLHWDLGRRLGLRTEGGSVANPPGFDGPYLASWRSIDFGVALWPMLLRRDVRVDHLAVEGLALDLQRRADGSANWVIPGAGGEAATGASAAQREDAAGGQGPRFALGSLAVQDSRVRYRDGTSARDITLTQTNLAAKLPDDLAAPELRFTDIALDARLQDWPLRLVVPALVVKRDGPALELPAFELELDEVRAVGNASAVLGAAPAAPAADARLRLTVPSLREQLKRFGRPLSPMQDPDVPGRVDLAARLLFDDGALRIDELVLRVDDTTLTGSVEVPQFDPLAIRFELEADQLNVDRYLTPSDVPSDPYELPVAQLRSIDARGTLRIGQLEAAGGTARQSVITVE